MTKLAVFDRHGVPTAFYDPVLHGETWKEGEEPGTYVTGRASSIPADAIEISDEQHLEFMTGMGRRRWNGSDVEEFDPPPTLEDFTQAVQALLDETARERRYDSFASAIGYRGDPNPTFNDEAEALFVWRSAVWTTATPELSKIESGERETPSVKEFIAELPAFTWPG